MDRQDNDRVRTQVRTAYAKVAKGADGCSVGCCGSEGAGSLAMGYSDEELEGAPEGSNLGLGCGNPQAIAALRPGETVLDLGSGAGYPRNRWRGRLGRAGIDMSFAIEYLPYTSSHRMGNKAQFGKVLLSVVRSVERVQRDQVCCGDLTLQQFDTLRRISTAERSTLGSVAQSLEIDLSTASRNLTRLEKQGYVSKVRDESDARTVILQLTTKGKRALSTLSCDERDAFAAVYDRISAAKRADVTASLTVLAQALDGTQDPSSDECCATGEEQSVRRPRTGVA